ncbi:MAG: response regulator [Janthinobacterium lividum]
MTGTAAAARGALQGLRILVVEDEYLIAQEIAEVLADAGAETLGPVPSVGEALRMVEAEERIDCALLDVNVGSEPVWPAVDVLLARGVPVVLATGYDARAVPRAYAHLPRCGKPASGQDLTRALAQALASRAPVEG